MKIGIFTDSHYSSQKLTCGNRYNSQSLNKIKDAYKFFKQEKCDLVISLGDLIDREISHEKEVENLKEVANVINNSNIRNICLMGNHDAFAFTENEFYEILNDCKPTDVYEEGKHLLFLDACYFKNGKHYAPGDSDWTDTFLPNIKELEQKLSTCCENVYIFLHQNLDTDIRRDHCVYNAKEINDILKTSQKVKTVFQGHYHRGNKSVHNGITYITFPAMCENEKAYFIEEI